MRRRIFFKLLAVFALVIASVTVTLNFSVRKAWQDSLFNEIQRGLQQKTLLFANRVNSDRSHNLQDIVSQEGQASGARATVIDATGNVLADSQADASKMESPDGQPEFAEALQGRMGTSNRRSAAIGVPFLYVAAPIPGGAVRLAYPLSDLEAETSPMRRTLLTSSAWACLVALLVAAVVAQIISRRLNRIVQFADKVSSGDLTARIASRWDDEIGQVAGALDQTARHLEANFLALQTSQHQLETLLNSMQDAVIAVGSDERVQWANQSMDRLVSKPARLNVPVVETVRDPDFLRAVRTASQTGKVVNARATSVLPARAYDVTAAPLPGGGAVAVLRDLTENERVEKTRRDFIANVSHELRTPLTSIQGYTETLLDSSPANNHVREFLEIIRKNAARMSRLTEDLLTLARVESGEQRFDFQTVLPAELLGEALESFAGVARAQGVQLEVENQTTTAVLADAEAIHQVFSNLIENALKYAASSPRIILGARQKERQVEFFVRDLGPGIPSEHVPRLFERFYRVDKARSRESGGTGLGLAIAKHIMLAHGGTIRAESELNHGATFLFLLPAAQVAEPAEVEANSAG